MEEIGLAPPSSSTETMVIDNDIEEERADDLYLTFKDYEKQLRFLEIQEEYVKDEHKNLKRELLRAQEEVKRIQSVPLVIGQFLEMIDQHTGIVGSTTGSNYYVQSQVQNAYSKEEPLRDLRIYLQGGCSHCPKRF